MSPPTACAHFASNSIVSHTLGARPQPTFPLTCHCYLLCVPCLNMLSVIALTVPKAFMEPATRSAQALTVMTVRLTARAARWRGAARTLGQCPSAAALCASGHSVNKARAVAVFLSIWAVAGGVAAALFGSNNNAVDSVSVWMSCFHVLATTLWTCLRCNLQVASCWKAAASLAVPSNGSAPIADRCALPRVGSRLLTYSLSGHTWGLTGGDLCIKPPHLVCSCSALTPVYRRRSCRGARNLDMLRQWSCPGLPIHDAVRPGGASTMGSTSGRTTGLQVTRQQERGGSMPQVRVTGSGGAGHGRKLYMWTSECGGSRGVGGHGWCVECRASRYVRITGLLGLQVNKHPHAHIICMQIAAMDTTAFLTSSAVKYGPVCKVGGSGGGRQGWCARQGRCRTGQGSLAASHVLGLGLTHT